MTEEQWAERYNELNNKFTTLTQAHQQLQDTVKFQEAQYLKEHEHWGECQWKLKHQQAVTEHDGIKTRLEIRIQELVSQLTATRAQLATIESGQAREDEIQILHDKIASWGDLDDQFHALQDQFEAYKALHP